VSTSPVGDGDVAGPERLEMQFGRPAMYADVGDVATGTDPAVQHADLVGGGEDVGEEEDLLVAELVGHPVDRVVGERHPRVLGLQAVVRWPKIQPPPPRHCQ
jgi:hypothetical protein